MKEKSMD